MGGERDRDRERQREREREREKEEEEEEEVSARTLDETTTLPMPVYCVKLGSSNSINRTPTNARQVLQVEIWALTSGTTPRLDADGKPMAGVARKWMKH